MTRPTICFAHGDAVGLFRGENGPRFGGSETQVYLMAKATADRGEFDVRVVSGDSVEGAQYPGVSFRTRKSVVQRGVPLVSRLVNRARLHRPYRDLEEAVLVQTILGPETEMTWHTARQRGLKFVYRVSCDADIDGSFFSPSQSGRYHEALADADGIIAQSREQQARLMSELGIQSTVVRSMVELPDEVPVPGGGYVLWVGRAAPVKRPWIMIETARTLPEIEFVMVMPAEVHVHGQQFMQFVLQEARLVPNLRIIPGVPYFEMSDFYRGAAILASTSALEGVPSVFVQAAAHGVPIVSLEVDPDRMLEQGGLGRCACGSISEFREAVADYMCNPGLVVAAGNSGFDYARAFHSVPSVEPVMSAFFRSVLAHPGG